MDVSRGNKEKFNNSYQNNYMGKGLSDDNLSEKANSVQTSYKYQKNRNGPNTITSKDSYRNNHDHYNNHPDDDDDLSYEISENSNLICPNCINCTLIEEKRKRENLERDLDDKYGKDHRFDDYGLYDRNRNHERDLIDERRRQREHNANEAYQNLARINANLSNKDKLIQMNENSRNPLNEGRPDYQYQRFQDEYNRRQKMINENLDKYYPNINNERPEVSSYYDNYVYNPKYNSNRREGYNDNYKDLGPSTINKKEYIKDLEDQINYKNELKKKEKEEERRRGQQQFEDMQKELKREEEERRMKERKQKDELIKANMELINQKNKMKLKELEDKLKYRELCDRQNEEYQKELQRQQLEKERMKDDIYNQNKNEYENRQKMKEMEREREKEKYLYDNKDGRGYGGKGYDKGYYGIYDDKRKGYGEGRGERGYEDGRYDGRGGKGYEEGRRGPGYEDGRYDGRGGKGYEEGRRGPGYEDGRYEGRGGKGYEDGRYDGRGGKGYEEGRYDGKGGRGKGYEDGRYDGKGKGYDDGRGGKGYEDGEYGIHDKKHKVKERMGRCCRCHKIFPRRLLTINRYFYKENRK